MRAKFQRYQTTVASSLVLLMIGGIVAWRSVDYGLGSVSQMGSGFFPFVLGLVLMFFAVMIWWQDRADCDLSASSSVLRSATLTLLGFLAIAWLIERSGLALALIVAVPFLCYADRQRSLKTVVPIVVSVLGFCYVIFVWLLEMRISF
jgi:hypothetical protein